MIETAKLEVFKFAAAHYISVVQRASDKSFLPDIIRYLKAYMNADVECAKWFLNQFCNFEIVKENLLDSSEALMRNFIGGLLYCAMLKVYE